MPNIIIEPYPTMVEVVAVQPDLAIRVPGTVAHDPSNAALVQGTTMALITATGKIRRYTHAPVKTAGAFATTSPTGSVVGASSIYRAGDVLVLAADGTTVIGTVASVAGDVITLTGNAAVNVAQGVLIQANDGSAVAVGFLSEPVDASVYDQTVAVYIGGYLVTAALIGLDAAAQTTLGMTSRMGGISRF